MIQQTFVELETGGNVRFEYGKSSDAWWELWYNVNMSDHFFLTILQQQQQPFYDHYAGQPVLAGTSS